MTTPTAPTATNAPPLSWDESLGLLESLPSLHADLRVAALDRLARDKGPDLREPALGMSTGILSDPAGGAAAEEETKIAFLADLLEGPEGLSAVSEALRGGDFRPALAARLAGPPTPLRAAAARCLLALGPSGWDDEALQVLANSAVASGDLPAAIARRHDLSGCLLGSSGEPLRWGLLLAARFPAEVPEDAFLAAVGRVLVHPEMLPRLAEALEVVAFPRLGEPLLRLYLQLDSEEREVLEPSLRLHAGAIQSALFRRRDVEAADSLVLSALLGRRADQVVTAVLSLPLPLQPQAVGRLLRLEAVVRLLPWQEWLCQCPAPFASLAAEAASRFGLRDLLPALRERAAAAPTAALVRAFGALADRASVPLLVGLLTKAVELRPIVLESLGRIGGAEARAVLRDVVRASADSGLEARKAFSALAACAGPGDEALMRGGAAHPDWYVRWTVIDPLARWASPECHAALVRLAADPVAAVAHRALAAFSG